tara:strand:+ start:2541 stop:2756 length:216 start_codon:yes stop_codon:yes gene_type:complete
VNSPPRRYKIAAVARVAKPAEAEVAPPVVAGLAAAGFLEECVETGGGVVFPRGLEVAVETAMEGAEALEAV